MQLRFARDGIHAAEHLARLYLVPSLHVHAGELAIESEIPTVLHQDALVVAGYHRNIGNHPVEDRLDGGVFRQGDVHAVVEGEFDVLVDGMIVLAERIYHGSVGRPRELAAVGCELLVQLLVDGGFGFLGRLLHHSLHLPAQGLYLAFLRGQFLLVARLILVEVGYKLLRAALIRLQVLEFHNPGIAQHGRLLAELLQSGLLLFYLRARVLYLERLRVEAVSHLLQIAIAPEALRETFAGEKIHVPDAGVPVLVGAAHKLVVVVGY